MKPGWIQEISDGATREYGWTVLIPGITGLAKMISSQNPNNNAVIYIIFQDDQSQWTFHVPQRRSLMIKGHNDYKPKCMLQLFHLLSRSNCITIELKARI